ncbi:MAG: murein biosynthesis integral membrane protein MurJ [Sporichthyaceae bacterium]
MAWGTVVSRLTGFMRNVVVVIALGTALFADAYNVANTIPNIVYILLIGGALNAVFVPQIVRSMQTDPDGGDAYVNRLLTVTAVLLVVVTAAAIAAAPLIVDLYSDFSDEQRSLTITFARYCLPQIIFYGLFVMLGQVLNARGRFGPMMWAPIVNNVVVIATFTAYLVVAGDVRTAAEISPDQIRLLGLGSTCGVVVQALVLVPLVRRSGLRFRPRFDWRGTGLQKTARLATWTVLVVAVNQIAYAVVTLLATKVSVAAVREEISYGVGYTAYTNAHLLWLLPQGVVTVSLLTAILPRMSRAAAGGDLAAVRRDLSYALRVSGLAVVPAAFFFLAMGPHITTTIFLHGEMTVRDTYAMGYMLSAFALGLIPFTAQYLLVRTFYAFEDTRSPFTVAAWIALAHATFSVVSYLALPPRWSVTGMAVGYGLAYAIGLVLTLRKLRRLLVPAVQAGMLRRYSLLAAASTPAALTGYGSAQILVSRIGDGLAASAAGLAVGGALFILVFMTVAHLVGITEIGSALRGRRRGGRGQDAGVKGAEG